nr:DUF4214 domain-containing protein [Pseudoduganella ginsengisoli]
MFNVPLQAGVTYSFAADGVASGGRWVQFDISGADGKLLGHVGNFDTGIYTFTPSRSGEYYATVYAGGYGATSNYAYTVNVARAADDVGANAGSAASLAIGATLSGTLEAGGGDRDWYAVNLTAGATYWFGAKSVAMSQSHSGQLRLLDAGGNELRTTQSSTSGAFADTLPFAPSASGTYYVEVSSPSRATGTYTISASVGAADDAGDTPQTAVALTPGTPLSGKLEVAVDKDMYKISGVAGMAYTVVLESAGNNTPKLQMTNGAGQDIPFKSLYWGGTNPDHLLVTAPADGDIYVTLSQSYGDGALPYKLSAQAYAVDDFSADKNTVGLLAPGAGVKGALAHPADSDWLRTTLEAGKTYAFQLLGAASNGGTLSTSRQYPLSVVGEGYTWTGAAADAITNAIETRMMFTPAKTGDYFVRVGSDDNFYGKNISMGTYTVRVLQTSGDKAAPVVVAQSHLPDAKDVALTDTRFALTFNEPVAIDKSGIKISDSQGKVVPPGYDSVGQAPYVNDSTVVLKSYGTWKPGATYTVTIPRDAIADLAGNPYTGPETFRFTTVAAVTAGTPAADLLQGGDGVTAVKIDGGAGIDTVWYGGSMYYHGIKRVGTEIQVTSYGGAVDVYTGVERVMMNDQLYAVDIDGNGGQAYRMYQAAFNRRPDSEGLGYWIGQLDKGMPLNDVARGFVASAEFKKLYGDAPSDDAFVTALYSNVLHRAPDADGFHYWQDVLHHGLPREEVLVSFGESVENKAALLEIIGNGFTYTPYLG